MALKDLLQLNDKRKKIGISEERIDAIKPHLRKYIAFWREYPDLFVDFLQTGGDPNIEPEFKFFAYQRVFLRVAMRYKYTYCVFPRGYSKSFLSVRLESHSFRAAFVVFIFSIIGVNQEGMPFRKAPTS